MRQQLHLNAPLDQQNAVRPLTQKLGGMSSIRVTTTEVDYNIIVLSALLGKSAFMEHVLSHFSTFRLGVVLFEVVI